MLDFEVKVMNGRLQHIDIAKGLGILLVVFGHNQIVLKEQGELFNIIYSFHLPLFFFLAGLFFKADDKITRLMQGKFDSIIKPYFVTLIVVGAIYIPLNHYSPIRYIAGVVYGTESTIPAEWAPLWFLPHLWAIFTVSWLLIKVTNLCVINKLWQIVVMLLILIIGILTIHLFWEIPINNTPILNLVFNDNLLTGLPLSLDIVLISLFFFLLGLLLKKQAFNFNVNYQYFALILFGFCFCHYYFNYTMDLSERRYDNIIISTFEAICGIYIILCFSNLISKFKGIRDILSYIGTGSMFILIFHQFFQLKALGLLSKIFHSYNYFINLGAFIVACAIPLLLWELVKKNDYLALLWLPLKSNKLSKK
ncbi:acyltransferase family protein [Phormidium sp. LEGE 05292]|uniref:acyltransferase family protein n=1 Tax=[Phormidium] sp. LEGE 05292 TaxID=767427 RepID=UPI00187F3492|nr:acyltransferase family protein [Phormidium sp. LEGE 05292]MBE9229517.1 acyltransferase family protein [Phormidium sp. LEGE 05292]